jgi:hypothetical protein
MDFGLDKGGSQEVKSILERGQSFQAVMRFESIVFLNNALSPQVDTQFHSLNDVNKIL